MKDIIKRYAWLGVMLAAFALSIALVFVFRAYNQQQRDSESAVKQEFSASQTDTVIVVATRSGFGINSATVYKEVLFNHDRHMFYIERNSSPQMHRDYNHPLYLEIGDVCVIWVGMNNDGEEEVILLENLTKKELNSLDLNNPDTLDSN